MTSAPVTQTLSLFQRLGGSAGIATLVDEIVAEHMVNPTIQARFLPYQSDPERLAAIKQHLRCFMEAGTGGPANYTGRSMQDAHRGMNISEQEYMAAIDDILAVLARREVDAETQKDVLAILYGLKAQILRL